MQVTSCAYSLSLRAVLSVVYVGHKLCIFTEAKSFVQGVAFDPLNEFLASMSCDRSHYLTSNPNLLFKYRFVKFYACIGPLYR